jgi:uncharacterized caspase-like protein
MRFILFTALLFLSISSAYSATGQRTALVIGNSAYSSGPLKNPVNDAADMAAMLKKLGFSVTLKKDAKQQEMDESIEAFGNRLKRGGVGLFYYAGHGVQVNGTNYLLPIGARINKEADIKYQAVDVNKILDEMANANNDLNIVMLDACRDNPYARSFRNATRGLAIVSSAPSGTFISYSTSPGNVARDGDGRNSPYTKAVLENIVKPGLTITDVFMNVRTKVKRETGQVPWELSSLEGRFYFAPQGNRQNNQSDTPSYAQPPESDELVQQKAALEREREELARAKQELERQKALDAEREQLAAERQRLEKERQALAQEQRQQTPSSSSIASSAMKSPNIPVHNTVVDWASVNRLQINKAFPHAEQIRAEIEAAGYRFDANDWFGPETPPKWVLMIGTDVDVATAQRVIAICLRNTPNLDNVVIMKSAGGLENNKRIYIGSLSIKKYPTASRDQLRGLLSPGLTKSAFQDMMDTAY